MGACRAGDRAQAEAALALGFVNKLVPRAELESETLAHPVGSAAGVSQRTLSEPCADAAVDSAAGSASHGADDNVASGGSDAAPTGTGGGAPVNVHSSASTAASRDPATVTTVPPSAGPECGASSRTPSDTTSKSTPLAV